MLHALSVCYFVTGAMIASWVIWDMIASERSVICHVLGLDGLAAALERPVRHHEVKVTKTASEQRPAAKPIIVARSARQARIVRPAFALA